MSSGPRASRAAFFLITPAPEDLGASLLGQRCQLLGGTRLADARFTSKHDQTALAGGAASRVAVSSAISVWRPTNTSPLSRVGWDSTMQLLPEIS